jgi:glycosyltransferase involved in cell wall biosynthesis
MNHVYKMNILLITSYYYPDEHIGASRWNRLSKYLNIGGDNIFVVASDNNGNYTLKSPYSNNVLRVDSNSSIPDKLLKFASSAKQNTTIEIKRQSYDTNLNQKSFILKLYESSIEFAGKFARFPHIQWWSSTEMVKSGLSIIKNNKIDIIVATHPFPGCLKAAKILSSQSNIPWIADMRDGWSSYYDLEYKSATFFNRLIQILEKRYLASASAIVAVNKQLANTLLSPLNKTFVISNSYDQDDFSEISNRLEGKKENETIIRLAFAGSILEGHSWDIFLDGLSLFVKSDINNKLEVHYYGMSFDILIANALKKGLPISIFFNHGYLSKKDLLIELSFADFLVVFGFKGDYGNTVTTGKIFDYMEVGKPVILSGRRDSELAYLIEETGIGNLASNANSIFQILSDFALDTKAYTNNQFNKRNTEAIQKYSAKETAIMYKKLMNKIIENKAK